jgi:hypothetical protein
MDAPSSIDYGGIAGTTPRPVTHLAGPLPILVMRGYLRLLLLQAESTSSGSAFIAYGSLAYSVLACMKIGISGSASFQRVRKSW